MEVMWKAIINYNNFNGMIIFDVYDCISQYYFVNIITREHKYFYYKQSMWYIHNVM